jgi:hypothetical protein
MDADPQASATGNDKATPSDAIVYSGSVIQN